jgi:hypothetical protein
MFMKKFICQACLLFFSVTAFCQQPMQEINPVLHDQSFIATFGTLPDATTNEQLRIRTHLSYVEQLLRMASPSGLTQTQQANRSAILDLLHEYRTAGRFPANKDYPGERRPCFIDADGNICAVGYLIEQTKGRELAEQINARHQYDLLLDMHEPAIEEWATECGLTLEECAMIQPSYWSPPPPQTNYADIKTGYGVSSGVLGGANLAVNIMNLSGRLNHPVLSYIGIASGAGQVLIGITNLKKTTTVQPMGSAQVTTSYKSQNNLSYLNIALGTTTVLTSALNLVMRPKKEKKHAFNLYSYPNNASSLSMGVSFTRKL